MPTDEELRTLPHIEVTSGSEWNQNTVKLGKLSMDKNDGEFELKRHVFGYHTTQTGKCSYSDNSTDKAIIQMHHHFYPLTPYQVSQYLDSIMNLMSLLYAGAF